MTDRRRHLRPNPHTLGVRVLAVNERTAVVRVRGPSGAVTWFQTLTAAERGVLVAALFGSR